MKKCECQKIGYFNSGFPGVLAHVEKNRILSRVERCDACLRYPTDRAAEKALRAFLRRRPLKCGETLLHVQNGDDLYLSRVGNSYAVDWFWFSNEECHERQTFRALPKAIDAVCTWLRANVN